MQHVPPKLNSCYAFSNTPVFYFNLLENSCTIELKYFVKFFLAWGIGNGGEKFSSHGYSFELLECFAKCRDYFSKN
jgi:hypothetical protein